jgi:hypothetical protein
MNDLERMPRFGSEHGVAVLARADFLRRYPDDRAGDLVSFALDRNRHEVRFGRRTR